MDDRTAFLLAALDAVSVSILLELLRNPATEASLVESLQGVTQSTVNRRLSRLHAARLITREPGNRRAPGRSWTVLHPPETEALVAALLALSEAIERRDRGRWAEARSKLLQARAARLGVRVVGDSDRSNGSQ